MDKWNGKVAIVTGASVGIGKDIALRLVEHGLKVVGCGRDLNKLTLVNKDISENAKGTFFPLKCDVTKEEDVLNLFNYVKITFKELSILINNAGISFNGSILKGKTEDWKAILDTNVLGLCMCTREAFSLMRENEVSNEDTTIVPGHIINLNSIAGHSVIPFSFFHLYTATKFAVTAITEGTRQELRELDSKIRVTQISPGAVKTEFLLRASGEEFQNFFRQAVPQALEPADISDAIIYTLSTTPYTTVNDIVIRPTTQVQ